MPNPTLDYRHVVAKAVPIYTCVDCGVKAEGDTVTLEVSNPHDLNTSCSIGNNHMPVGWAGYGRGAHRCPDCAR